MKKNTIMQPTIQPTMQPEKSNFIPTFPTLFKNKKNGKFMEWNVAVIPTIAKNDKSAISSCCPFSNNSVVDGKPSYDITVTFGEYKGNAQTHVKQIQQGKSNRTALEQAILEAKSKWNDKKKEGYMENVCVLSDELSAPSFSSVVFRPMLAQTFLPEMYFKTEHKSYKIPFPAYVQRKYDGIRCVCHYIGGEEPADFQLRFETRKGIEIKILQLHSVLLNELSHFFCNDKSKKVILDGELYTNELTFETLNGLLRVGLGSKNTEKMTEHCADGWRSQPNGGFAPVESPCSGNDNHILDKMMDGKVGNNLRCSPSRLVTDEIMNLLGMVEYHIYDIYSVENPTMTFEQRKSYLENMFNRQCINFTENTCEKTVEFSKLQKVVTEIVNNVDDVKLKHDEYVFDGYEGVIVRDANGIYEVNKRSKYLQKYKEFMEDEFVIVGFHDGEGIDKELVIWECITNDPAEKIFSVKPKLTHEKRRFMYENGGLYIGKKITVIFQEYSNDGIPRFPVGKEIRDVF